MFDRDDTASLPLSIALVTAGFVVACVIALAVAAHQGQQRDRAWIAIAAEGLGPTEVIAFDAGIGALPAEAKDAFDQVAKAARANDGFTVLLLPFCAADADGAALRLADARARAVSVALRAQGVATLRIMLARPEETALRQAGRTDRVEIRLQ